MYLGTNDKDTYEPYGTPEEAKAKVDEVLTKHFEGFTIQDAIHSQHLFSRKRVDILINRA